MAVENTYDVIIVGAGPGGSSAAYELAKLGHRVLVLEKYTMPRMKPCGGCLSAKLQRIVDDDLAALSETDITRVIFTFRGRHEIVIESPTPVAYMVMRDKFDHYRIQKAVGAGAGFHGGEAVQTIEGRNGYFEARTAKGVYRGRYLIGADGVNGITARALGYGPKRQLAVALEGEATIRPEAFAQMNHTVRLDIGDIPYGYGWVFPKKDHWSIGVGSMRELDKHPKSYYTMFVEDQNIREDIEDEQRRGFRIPLYGGRKSKISGKVEHQKGNCNQVIYNGEVDFYHR